MTDSDIIDRLASAVAAKVRVPLQVALWGAEIAAVLHCLGYQGGKAVTAAQRTGVALLFALETAMRMGEICRLTRADLSGPVAIVREAKTAAGVRRVPLSKEALRLLDRLPETDGPVFGLAASVMEATWRKARDKAGLADLHFHDSRATAITRLARRLDVLELARMVGHRDLRQLQVYYRATAEELAAKLG